MPRRLAYFLLPLLALLSCQERSTLEERLRRIENQLSDLKEENTELSESLNEGLNDLYEQMLKELEDRSSTSAELDCNTSSYQVLRAENSHFLFLTACESIEPYLTGHKVEITIGNPYFATFREVSLKIRYGENYLKAIMNLSTQVEIHLDSDLKPGTWKTITARMNPSTKEQMNVIYIASISINSTILSKAR